MFDGKHEIADRFIWRADFTNTTKAIPTVVVKAFANVKRHERAF